MKLTHIFTRRGTKENRAELAGAGSLNKLVKLIDKQAEAQNPDNYDPNKYKGDAFEWFAEFFFKQFSTDKLFLNVYDYQPIKGQEYGVDGLGYHTQDITQKVAVQMKYKYNMSSLLSAEKDNLSNFGVNAMARYGVELDEKYIVVFTTAKGITRATQEGIYFGKVRCINGELIKKYVDNNPAFWAEFAKAV